MASTPKNLQLLPLMLLLFLFSCSATPIMAIKIFNVQHYGAIPDGKTDAATAFQETWRAACRGSSKPSLILVPSGHYLLNPVIFRGPCSAGLRMAAVLVNATLLAPPSYVNDDKWIEFKSVQGLSIYGGTFDGRGQSLWKCKAQKNAQCPHGATSLSITRSNDVRLRNLTVINSARFHVGIRNSSFITVDGANINASKDSPNTDGIHVEYSSYVTISDTNVSTGDDCVSLSHKSRHILMDNLTCGPGHGVSIGSLGENPNIVEEVYNITGRSMIFDRTTNGLRIKTWATKAKGEIKSVNFKNVTMIDVKNPIIVIQDYCDTEADHECKNKTNSEIAISHLSYENVKGSSTQQVAVKFDCSEAKPCTDITLKDINVTYIDKNSKKPKKTTAECTNAGGQSSGVMHPPSCF